MICLDTIKPEPCVWMTAGVLKYKLCRSHYDCEHCPLDAALHGISHENSTIPPDRVATRSLGTDYPFDRIYTPGHTWLQEVDISSHHYRLGLDSFATSLLAVPRQISWSTVPFLAREGESLVELDFDDGCLKIAAPLSAHLIDRNIALNDHPDALISDPYQSGWLCMLSQVDPAIITRMDNARSARENARLDMRRLRRRIALNLLAQDSEVTPETDLGGRLYADPWHALGGVGYLGLIQELMH